MPDAVTLYVIFNQKTIYTFGWYWIKGDPIDVVTGFPGNIIISNFRELMESSWETIGICMITKPKNKTDTYFLNFRN